MKISILTNGSRGDIQPFLALGIGLQQAGHRVRLAAPLAYRDWITAYGLEYASLGKDQSAYLDSQAVRQNLETGGTLGFRLQRLRDKRRVIYQENLQAWEACQGADLLVYRLFGSLAVDSIAERLGIACVGAGLLPQTPTGAFASLYLTQGRDLGPLLNRLSYFLAASLLRLYFGPLTNQFRRHVLGLPALSLLCDTRDDLPVVYAFSPLVIPPPADWPENVRVSGYWFMPDDPGWQPEPGLEQFIEKDQPPVYIGFGSMPARDPRLTLHLIQQAVLACGQRALVASGWQGLAQPGASPDGSFYYLQSAPHAWLFPRMAAVVHHGGAGTTGESLRSGSPALVVAHNYDQPYWGKVVQGLGAGPAPLLRSKLNAERLAAGIQSCLVDAEIRQRARSVGEQIRQEYGITTAIRDIKQLCGFGFS